VKPLVGLLVIDRPKTTRRCIQAILKTVDRKSFDWVVVDNGSNDQTQDMLSHYRSEFDQLVRYDWNTGCTFGTNKWMSFRQPGQHCMSLNADTWVQSEGWLKAMLDVLEEPGIGIVAGRRPEFWIDTPGRFNFLRSGNVEPREIRGHWCEMVAGGAVIMPFTMIRGEVVDQIGFMNESTNADDIDYNPRVFISGWQTCYCTDIIFYQPQDEAQNHRGYDANRALLNKCLQRYQADLQRYHLTKSVYRGTRFLPETMNDPLYTSMSDTNWKFFREWDEKCESLGLLVRQTNEDPQGLKSAT